MKKLLLSVIILMISSATCFAQFDENTFFVYGKIGGNVSNTHARSGYQYNEWNAGLLIGAGVGYQFDENWAVTADVVYSQQGVRESSATAKIDGVFVDLSDINTSYDYLNIPILANYYVAPGISLKGGVQLGYLLHACDKCKGTFAYGGKMVNLNYNDKFTDKCNKFDVAIPIGVSYDVTENMQVDIRYTYGLTKVVQDKYADIMQCKNKCVTLSLAYRLPL